VVAAAVLVGLLVFGGGPSYSVSAQFQNANQLVRGNLVQMGGAPVGSVKDIEVSPDGQAIIKLSIDEAHSPLRTGTIARIRQASQSGIANRYVDLYVPDGRSRQEIPDGGTLAIDQTATSVDIDQLFNTFDPETRKGFRGFFRGWAKATKNRGDDTNEAFRYLNPSLSTSRRLFQELNRDTPLLENFLVDSAKLVTALAERRDDLAGLIGNLNDTTRAIGDQKAALAQAIGGLPDFMRQSNTTFVNLRSALNDVDPLVEASKPVAKRLGPFLDELRPFARDARPTIADLRRVVKASGADNDLTDLTKTFGPLAAEALDTKTRKVDAGGGAKDVGETVGAFPATVKGFEDSTPIFAHGRPYTPELMGWFDDFSTSGAYDAIGGVSRAQVYFNALLLENLDPTNPLNALIPISQRGDVYKQLARIGQFKRCPGGAEEKAPDGSNVLSEAQQRELDCREADRGTGPY
jgi:phospholipid/cholesterol/gamma-HCH transport system substrate-binding protein